MMEVTLQGSVGTIFDVSDDFRVKVDGFLRLDKVSLHFLEGGLEKRRA